MSEILLYAKKVNKWISKTSCYIKEASRIRYYLYGIHQIETQ